MCLDSCLTIIDIKEEIKIISNLLSELDDSIWREINIIYESHNKFTLSNN